MKSNRIYPTRSNTRDRERLLHLAQQLYAHALTLQEVIRNDGEVSYEVLRPRCERQAAQQFEVFQEKFDRPARFRKRAAGASE